MTNKPRYLRIWDNGGETIDRYTVAFTGRGHGARWGLAMSAEPEHPQGFCQHWEMARPVDEGGGKHLGRRIQFADLPKPCQRVVSREYGEVWGM